MMQQGYRILALDGRGGRVAAGVGGGSILNVCVYGAVTHSVIALTRADSSPIKGEHGARVGEI
jgi:hypothetical protein